MLVLLVLTACFLRVEMAENLVKGATASKFRIKIYRVSQCDAHPKTDLIMNNLQLNLLNRETDEYACKGNATAMRDLPKFMKWELNIWQCGEAFHNCHFYHLIEGEDMCPKMKDKASTYHTQIVNMGIANAQCPIKQGTYIMKEQIIDLAQYKIDSVGLVAKHWHLYFSLEDEAGKMTSCMLVAVIFEPKNNRGYVLQSEKEDSREDNEERHQQNNLLGGHKKQG